MVTAILVLVLVAALVALSVVRPSGAFLSPSVTDRDRERMVGELRAMPGYHSDIRVP